MLFRSMSANQRQQYDQKKLVLDMRNRLLLWTAIFVVGGILSQFVWTGFVYPTFIIWLVLVFKNFSLNPPKAYEKYKL